MLSSILTVLLIINAFILIFLIVVLQQGNEGGISASFGAGGGSSGFFGASGGIGFIIKATWFFGFLFFVLTMSQAWVKTHDRYVIKSRVEQELLKESPLDHKEEVTPMEPPVAPTAP
jgi:preprotein translocase subunit SecG